MAKIIHHSASASNLSLYSRSLCTWDSFLVLILNYYQLPICQNLRKGLLWMQENVITRKNYTYFLYIDTESEIIVEMSWPLFTAIQLF